MNATKAAVLLLAHGSPDSPADVHEFMRHVSCGRGVPEQVLEEVRLRYSLIGKSPLTEITLGQAAALQKELDVPVYTGMRNWKPFIAEAVRQMLLDGVQQMVTVCLAPQNSSTSVGLYKSALLSALQQEIAVEFVESWHDHPLLVRAFAEKLEPVWRRASAELGAPAPVIFTAHSVPTRSILMGDTYESQVKETARLVGQQIADLPAASQSFAFQSQGMSGGPWLGPTVESVMLSLHRQGHKGVVLSPIGFVCDHIEVLYDVDIAFQRFATEQGMKFWRTESLNTSLTFIAALASLASSRLAGGQKT